MTRGYDKIILFEKIKFNTRNKNKAINNLNI